jgi:hypothetical protein
MNDRGSIAWKIGPKRDVDGNCISKGLWGHPCLREKEHDGMCCMILDPERVVTILSDSPDEA